MAKSDKQRVRDERLAAELRANLQKRKVQARARRAGEADGRRSGIDAAEPNGGATDDPERDGSRYG